MQCEIYRMWEEQKELHLILNEYRNPKNGDKYGYSSSKKLEDQLVHELYNQPQDWE